MMPRQVVILCGGLGTRLRPKTIHTPKPMVLCNGKPFLWYLFKQFENQGVLRFLLLTGYLSNVIYDYFGSGEKWNWDIKYSDGPIEWDTGKRIWEAREKLDDVFYLLYSDNFSVLRLNDLYKTYKKVKQPITLTLAKKNPGNFNINENHFITESNNERNNTLKYVEIGYMIVNKNDTLNYFDNINCSFSEIIFQIVKNNELCVNLQDQDYYSISDLDRFCKTELYLKNKNIITRQRWYYKY